MLDFKSRLADRGVFVTGADGFIGSHLVDELVEYGADVHAFVRASSSGELKNIRHHRDEITIHRGDLRDPISVKKALSVMQEYDDALVFHFAGPSPCRRVVRTPIQDRGHERYRDAESPASDSRS